jgi:hypothetical protein
MNVELPYSKASLSITLPSTISVIWKYKTRVELLMKLSLGKTIITFLMWYVPFVAYSSEQLREAHRTGLLRRGGSLPA